MIHTHVFSIVTTLGLGLFLLIFFLIITRKPKQELHDDLLFASYKPTKMRIDFTLASSIPADIYAHDFGMKTVFNTNHGIGFATSLDTNNIQRYLAYFFSVNEKDEIEQIMPYQTNNIFEISCIMSNFSDGVQYLVISTKLIIDKKFTYNVDIYTYGVDMKWNNLVTLNKKIIPLDIWKDSNSNVYILSRDGIYYIQNDDTLTLVITLHTKKITYAKGSFAHDTGKVNFLYIINKELYIGTYMYNSDEQTWKLLKTQVLDNIKADKVMAMNIDSNTNGQMLFLSIVYGDDHAPGQYFLDCTTDQLRITDNSTRYGPMSSISSLASALPDHSMWVIANANVLDGSVTDGTYCVYKNLVHPFRISLEHELDYKHDKMQKTNFPHFHPLISYNKDKKKIYLFVSNDNKLQLYTMKNE
jgi:hypothetical protein